MDSFDEGDMRSFCKLLGFHPTLAQQQYLSRVSCNRARLGMRAPFEEAFPVLVTSMLWRALCFEVPSICLVEFHEHGEIWIKLIESWMSDAHPRIKDNIEVSETQECLKTSRGVHVCHIVDAFDPLDKYMKGRQDILLLDFDEIPSTRMQEALDLSEGALMYFPRFLDSEPSA